MKCGHGMVSSNREGVEWNVDMVWYLVTGRVLNGM